jgi:hypothetical protein
MMILFGVAWLVLSVLQTDAIKSGVNLAICNVWVVGSFIVGYLED